ncbi:hypothetical protein ACP70R_016434 [Stipagrostis hirtigluma subsp. patula]
MLQPLAQLTFTASGSMNVKEQSYPIGIGQKMVILQSWL